MENTNIHTRVHRDLALAFQNNVVKLEYDRDEQTQITNPAGAVPTEHEARWNNIDDLFLSKEGSALHKNNDGYFTTADEHTKREHLVCLYCGRTFTTKIALSKHRTQKDVEGSLVFVCKRKDAEDSESLQCQICCKNFKTLTSLKTHLKAHCGSREFACAVCHKRFSQDGHLKNHLAIHARTKLYECEVCKKRFTQSGHLYNHRRTHTGEKRFQCEVCEKRFTQNVHLKNHAKIHAGVKDHRCVLCDKLFTQSGHLQSHMRTHTGERKYQCPHCSLKFRQSGHLSTHIKLHRKHQNDANTSENV